MLGVTERCVTARHPRLDVFTDTFTETAHSKNYFKTIPEQTLKILFKDQKRNAQLLCQEGSDKGGSTLKVWVLLNNNASSKNRTRGLVQSPPGTANMSYLTVSNVVIVFLFIFNSV